MSEVSSESAPSADGYQMNVYIVGVRDCDDPHAWTRDAYIAHDEKDAKVKARQEVPDFYSRPEVYHVKEVASDV